MWKYYQPVEVIFGEGEIKNLGRYMEERGFENALLIADPFIEKSGLADRIVRMSGGRVLAVTSEVEPNPTIQNIDACAERARELEAECIIAVGGGSSMDCAKSTAVAVKQGCTARELMDGIELKESLPVITITTTAGTGSEVTAGAVLSDKEKEEKIAILHPVLFSRLSIVDPEVTYSCPPAVTSRSGIDVIAHALDALTSIKANPVTDSLAVRAARLAFENLEKAVSDGSHTAARRNMSMASVIAGLAFSQTGTTGSHACSYILTSKYHMPHGEACAFTLDYWFQRNSLERRELQELTREIGFESVNALCGKFLQLKKAFGFKTTLEEADIPVCEVDVIVRASMASGNMTNNIAKPTEEELKNMFLSLSKP